MTKPSILLVSNFLSASGGSRHFSEDLSVRLNTRGWNIIETSHQSGRIPKLVEMVTCALIRQRHYQIACVDVYSGPAFIWAEVVTALLSMLKKPVILLLRGGGLVDFARVHSRRISALLQKARIVATPSQYLQKGLRGYCRDIRYLPNGAEIAAYGFRLRAKPKPNVVWLRAFHEIYQPALAVHAIAMLQAEFPDIHLIMVGPDKHDGTLVSALALAQALGVKTRLEIVGPVSKADVPSWLAKGDIFLNTTTVESFGVSVLEAALVGLPIVTTDAGELPLLWQDGKNVLVVPRGDAPAMAGAIRRVLTEPGLAEALSQNARAKAEQFDWAQILPRWEALLLEAHNGWAHTPNAIRIA